MHEDEHVVIAGGGGSGVSAGLLAGILIVILIVLAVWWFGFGPGVARNANQPGTNINVNVPTAVPQSS